VAMGEEKGQGATRQVEMVCLDELVPEDDRYRRLDRLVDWGFVRELAAAYYARSVGRPSIDPIVLVKLMVAGTLEGIGSVLNAPDLESRSPAPQTRRQLPRRRPRPRTSPTSTHRGAAPVGSRDRVEAQ